MNYIFTPASSRHRLQQSDAGLRGEHGRGLSSHGECHQDLAFTLYQVGLARKLGWPWRKAKGITERICHMKRKFKEAMMTLNRSGAGVDLINPATGALSPHV
jgi:hypothetical protein